MQSPKITHTLRSLLNSYFGNRKTTIRNGRIRSIGLTAAIVMILISLTLFSGNYMVKANGSSGLTTAISGSYAGMTRNIQRLAGRLFGSAVGVRTSATAACALTQQITVTGCYYNGSASRATVSVEVGWTGAVNGDTITVSLDGGAQTRTINPEQPGGGVTIVTPQVVAFEINADGLPHTITSALSGSSSCSTGPDGFTAPASCAPNLCTAGELGGTIYFDFNGDGIRQAGEVLGVPNVTINAYDSSNTLVGTATSNAEGRYEFSAANANSIGAGSYPLRLEVTNLPASGFNTTTRMGTDNGSSVQFVSSAQCGVDVSVLDQRGYCQNNPLMVLPCYVNGDPLPPGSSGDDDALVAFPYLSNGTPSGIIHLASAREVGSLWGVAYNKYTKRTFSSAILKRHIGLGPLGLGGIYVTNMNTFTTSGFVDVTALGVDVGQSMVPTNATRGLPSTKTQPNHDPAVFPLIGKVGIGDIDISEDGSTLWFVNLHDKKLYSIDITAYNASNTLPTMADVASTAIPLVQPCANGSSRPFGTTFFNGKVYVGAVCDALGGSRSDLRASVFVYDPVGASWNTVFNFPLTYPKGYPVSAGVTGWYTWKDTFNELITAGRVDHPSPLLADIVFDSDGTMVMGFGDRSSLQTGYNNYGTNTASTTLYSNFVGGDVLRAYFSNGTFVLENNAKTGPNTGAGVNNNQGPGFGEFYNDNAACCHTEIFVGGLALKPGSGEVVAVAMDPNVPLVINTNGVRTLNNFTGNYVRNFAVYTGGTNTTTGTFGKATGLGDVELACGLVNYLEIGNRVWMDRNVNGIQDADEMPVQGATVHLYRQGGPDGIPGNGDDNTSVATAVTDANGNYRFTSIDANEDGVWDSDGNVNDSVGVVGGVGLLPNTNYLIRMDRASDYQSGGALSGKYITPANVGMGGYGQSGDLRDSDASWSNVYGLPGGEYPEIVVQHLENGVPVNGTGAYGQVDHTLDFGMLLGASIGNTVWYDADNDGQIDPMEKGINGVRVELFHDADNSGTLTGAEQTPIAIQITSSGGYYLFTQRTDLSGIGSSQPLIPGQYFVGIAASNFNPGGALFGLFSSGTTANVSGTAVESAIAGNSTTNSDADNFDDGLKITSGFYSGGVMSGVLNIQPGTEPANETTAGMPGDTGGNTPGHPNTLDGTLSGGGIPDVNSNITVDFGFYGLSIGNLIFDDSGAGANYNNAVFDNDETGIPNVTVNLYAQNGTTLLMTKLTDANGKYLFPGLAQGSYFVEVVRNSALDGYASSKDGPNANNPTAQDNDDNGPLTNVTFTGVRSPLIVLTPNDPNATGEIDQNQSGCCGTGGTGFGNPVMFDHPSTVDANSNLEVDFGFVKVYSLGNRVWRDLDNSGTINVADGPNPGIDGVQVRLLLPNGTVSAPDINGFPIAATTTSNNGCYRFDNIPRGDYIVEIGAVSFQNGQPLENYQSSTGAFATTGPNEPAPDPDANQSDSDDNGTLSSLPPASPSVRSAVVTLGEGNGRQEPINEPDLCTGDPGPNQRDDQSNLTVDFGFVPKLNLGNLVWKDTDNNGQFDVGEQGIGGALVELFRDNGTTPNVFDPADTLVTTTLTGIANSGGIYSFNGLLPGRYFVRIAPSNFQAGGNLVDCFSSTVTQPNADNNVDNDDNGIDNLNPAVNGVLSGPVNLAPFTEPDTLADGDGTNGNLTVDFGFYRGMNLGNQVWKDTDNDGIKDATEVGINNITIELFLDRDNDNAFEPTGDDAPVLRTTQTQNGGFYNFTDLQEGNYFLRIPAAEFQPGGDLNGCTSSTPTETNPNNDIDNNDNGIDDPNPAANGIRSNRVTLTANGEPDVPVDGDGKSGNLTIDFGFYTPMALGNLVWKDYDNDGVRDVGEPGVPGVTVELWRDNGDNVFNAATDTQLPLQPTSTTDLNGQYLYANLSPGNYFARIPAAEFQPGGQLEGCFSSVPTEINPNDDGDNNDNGLNNPNPASNGILTGLITMQSGTEPTNDGDGDSSNQTIDFGFYPPMSLGNLVWKDYNNNGLKDVAEPGYPGVTVELYLDNGNGQFDPGIDQPAAAPTVTDGNGFYQFINLLPGNYIVRIPAAEFQPGGDLYQCLSSTTTEVNPNGDVDNNDNGLDSPAPQNTGINSGVVTLIGNSEPTNDGDGPNGNQTVDFGFYSVMRLGNIVWKDLNDDGLRQSPAEPGVDGVLMELFTDRNNNGLFEPNGADAPRLAITTTADEGLYQFTNLLPGRYFVRVAPVNFDQAGPLYQCYSSSVDAPNPNNNIDNDDNGINNPNPQGNGIASNAIDLVGQDEPDTPVDGDDRNGNLTLDFGFSVPVSVGNLVWKDYDNDGLKDANEPGVDGVTVELIRDANNNNTADDAVIATTTTAAGGQYGFSGLQPGTYFVRIAAGNFIGNGMLVGCYSSTGNDGGDAVDNDDNGVDNPTPGNGGVVSNPIPLAPGTEPTNDGDGPNGNQTIDFGFYIPVSLGNLIWKDLNNDGLANNNEPGVNGVLVELYRETNGTPGLQLGGGGDASAGSQLTAGGGFYNFTGLVPGDYYVFVPASNLTGGGALSGCFSSTVDDPTPNNDQDNDDNGLPGPNGGVVTNAVTLTGNGEPGPQVDGDGPNSNLTVDLGFYPPMSLGNLVWKDLNNDGLYNNGEPGVPSVSVELFKDNGDGIFNAATDTLIPAQPTSTTNASGIWNYTNLTPGTYFARIPASEFQSGGDLVGCASSEPTEANPNNDVDNNDNGLNNPNPAANGIVTGAVTLTGQSEPTNDGDGNNGNQTVDFGFTPLMTLGNLLWKDYDGDGVRDTANPNEPGVGNVTVELIRDTNGNNIADDPVIQTTTTSNVPATLGQYSFSGLYPATYFVRIPAAEFQPGGDLAGCLSSPGADGGDSIDNNDNGVDSPNPQTTGITSNPIPLIGEGEPTDDGDGPNGNQTVDFGFIPQMSLGNLIWKDLNNNGQKDASEPGVNGVRVELYRETNSTPGLQIGSDTLVGFTVSANGGLYNFNGLQPGDYYALVPASELTGNGALAGCSSSTVDDPNPNNDEDNDDNGLPGPNGGVVTGVVTLIGNSEPTNDGDDSNGNQTIDLGFYPPMNLGNLVWKDLDNNGRKDVNEPGVTGVLVELFKDDGDNVFEPGTGDTLIPAQASSTTNASGFWGYINLAPGTYFARVAAAEFQLGGDLYTCLSSEPTAANPNNDVDNDDNGLDDPNPAANGIRSGPITLIGGSEPTNDGDGNNGNLTVDFGFIPMMNLGNLIWKDYDNDGIRDTVNPSEPGIGGVTIELYRDAAGAGAGTLGAEDGPAYRTTTSLASGEYSFQNLPPGNYLIFVPASNFSGAGALAGCFSSTVDNGNPNNDVDNDDNGLPGPQGGVVTGVITLIGGSEPTNDGDGNNGNLTVDLGFYPPMNLGNLIWKDQNNDGIRNAGEPAVDGVLVELFRDSNNNGTFEPASDAPAGTQTTAGGGLYNFTNLTPGTYFVRVAASNFFGSGALVGCLSSTVTVANPNNDVDNDDNGIDSINPGTTGVVSGAITLIGGSEPTNDGDGNNGNLTLDFGFYAPLSLGNLVWKDYNNNGLKDANEPGVDGVTVELIRDANNNNQPDDAVIGTQVTAGGGLYQFTNLLPGDYFVRIAASNFQTGQSLAGCFSSTGNDNGDQVDNNDNGVDNPNPQNGGIVSVRINLAGGQEPTGDGDGANGNQTIDFGFYAPLSLGNLVWKDQNNDGRFNNGEQGINGVSIELFRDNGNNQFEPTIDQFAGTTTTAGGGLYKFTNLTPGNYFVRIAPVNFTGNGVLVGCTSSTVTNTNPNTDIDNDDNGLDTGNPATDGVVSGMVTLSGNSEPTNDGDDANGNMTVDFGFITGNLSLGNMVWKDTNQNSLRDAGEPGVANVQVELIRDANANNQPDDAVIATVTTNQQGVYQFTNLTPGNYFVRIAGSNFGTGGALRGCVSSPGTNPPNNDVDDDDNGSDSLNPSANPPTSGVVTLSQNGEPTNDGDGSNSNLTVDFGFVNPLNVTIEDPADCIGPGTILQVEAVVTNTSNQTQQNNPGPEVEINLPPILAAVNGSCVVQGGNGNCTITGTQRITWDGSYGPGERVVIRYRVQIAGNALSGQQFCITSLANFDADNNGSNETQTSVTVCATIECQSPGPGTINPGCSTLFYPIYTSSSVNPNASNTRISITNSNPNKGTAIHLFFVDGTSCSVTDAFVCLTANQTTSFIASDLDPGTTGYLIAVAVDQNGCPTSFNWLLGDEYVKFESGHYGNLTADCATAIPGGTPACQIGSNTATLNFDGVNYSRLPQTLAVDNIPDRASGNDTLLVLNRLSGNLATGMDKLGTVSGLLYDDTEGAYSFAFTPATCQFRSVLSNNLPRTAPRFETIISAGRSGWMRLSAQGAALSGAMFNRNPNSAASANAFNGAHGLHALTLNPSATMIMPVFPPSCL